MRRVVLLLAAMTLALVAASGVALAVTKVGNNGPDTLTGTNRDDHLIGRGGNDDIFGRGGSDDISGGEGRDVLQGGPAPPQPEFPPRCEPSRDNEDDILGGKGNDFLNGNVGSDRLFGGGGNDVLWEEVCFLGGESELGTSEVLEGGEGGDFLWARDTPFPSRKDLVMCGEGRDVAFVDRADVVVGCERVLFRHPTHEEHLRALEQRGLSGRV